MIRNTIVFIFLLKVCLAFGQTDTLFSKKGKFLSCKIIEIGESDIKYRTLEPNSPVYVVPRGRFFKYSVKNGYSDLLVSEQIYLDHRKELASPGRTVIKIHPFSFLNNQISMAVERVLNPSANFDLEAGRIDATLNSYPVFDQVPFRWYYPSPADAPVYSGYYVKPGAKFFPGKFFERKFKVVHPLAGSFVKIDFVFSRLEFKNVSRNERIVQQNFQYKTDVTCQAHGVIINVGRQILLTNYLSFEYYAGIGFVTRTIFYSNKSFLQQQSGMVVRNQALDITNYHGFHTILGSNGHRWAIALTAGFRLGLIIPETN